MKLIDFISNYPAPGYPRDVVHSWARQIVPGSTYHKIHMKDINTAFKKKTIMWFSVVEYDVDPATGVVSGWTILAQGAHPDIPIVEFNVQAKLRPASKKMPTKSLVGNFFAQADAAHAAVQQAHAAMNFQINPAPPEDWMVFDDVHGPNPHDDHPEA